MSNNESPEADEGKPVYVVFVKGGVVQKQTFSSSSAQEAGIFDAKAYGLIDSGVPEDSADETHCVHCGYGSKDLNRTGRMGCAKCMDSFSEHIMPLVERMHKGTCHRGKIPGKFEGVVRLYQQLKDLRGEIGTVICEENYEMAAVIRDRITEIEAQLADATQLRT